MGQCEFTDDAGKTLKQAADDLEKINPAWSGRLQVDTALMLVDALRAEKNGDRAGAEQKISAAYENTVSGEAIGFMGANKDSIVQSRMASQFMLAEILDGRGEKERAAKVLEKADRMREENTGVFGMSTDSSFLMKAASNMAWAAHYYKTEQVGLADKKLQELDQSIAELKQRWGGPSWSAVSAAEVELYSVVIQRQLKHGDQRAAFHNLGELKDKVTRLQSQTALNADSKVKLHTAYEIMNAESAKQSGDCREAIASYTAAEQDMYGRTYKSIGDLFSSTMSDVGLAKTRAALAIAKATGDYSAEELRPVYSLLLTQHYRTGGKNPVSR